LPTFGDGYFLYFSRRRRSSPIFESGVDEFSPYPASLEAPPFTSQMVFFEIYVCSFRGSSLLSSFFYANGVDRVTIRRFPAECPTFCFIFQLRFVVLIILSSGCFFLIEIFRTRFGKRVLGLFPIFYLLVSHLFFSYYAVEAFFLWRAGGDL